MGGKMAVFCPLEQVSVVEIPPSRLFPTSFAHLNSHSATRNEHAS